MIVEILEVLERIILMIMPFVMIIVVVVMISEIYKKPSLLRMLKGFFCISMTTAISFFIMMMLFINVYQVAVIWEGEDVEPWLKELSYVGVEFIWQMIGIIMIYFVWHTIYFKQLIPGTGTVKERLKTLFKYERRNKNGRVKKSME